MLHISQKLLGFFVGIFSARYLVRDIFLNIPWTLGTLQQKDWTVNKNVWDKHPCSHVFCGVSPKNISQESLGYVFAKHKNILLKMLEISNANIPSRTFWAEKRISLAIVFWKSHLTIPQNICWGIPSTNNPELFFWRTSPAHFPPRIFWGIYQKNVETMPQEWSSQLVRCISLMNL